MHAHTHTHTHTFTNTQAHAHTHTTSRHLGQTLSNLSHFHFLSLSSSLCLSSSFCFNSVLRLLVFTHHSTCYVVTSITALHTGKRDNNSVKVCNSSVHNTSHVHTLIESLSCKVMRMLCIAYTFTLQIYLCI